jgi:hypothetical protein
MTAAEVEVQAGSGATRIVVAPTSPDLDQQREAISAFADRLGLP